MASIELYKSKINSMSNYIAQAKSAVSDFCVDLSALKKKVLGINSSVCDSIVTSISSSSKTQEEQIAGLEATQKEVNAFIQLAKDRDDSAAAEIVKQKKDFYKEYSYLKPESEKSKWEKFCDGLKKVGEWCKDHWKLIVTVVICIAAIALICTGVGGILGAAAIGALMGAASGGLMGGITSVLSGGSFLEGFEEGAFSGAITGAIMGGIGGAGALFGKSVSCLSKLGKAIKMTAKISNGLSNVMDGFDTLSMGLGLIDPDNPLTALNNKLHSSKLYDGFQTGVSVVAAFTGGASSTMACFVAGTLINTMTGLVAIEHLRAGDKIIAADPDTFEVGEKTILEAFERQVDKLVHLTISGEKIVTTDNHPFYVQGRGFIQAKSLFVGDKLISVNGKDLIVETLEVDEVDEPVTVYNFKVEDYHTYFVGENAVWVHNNDCINKVESGDIELKTTKEKGNYGEMKMDEYYESKGYKRISKDSVSSLDDPIHHGIDGVYHNPNGDPKYIISESKYGSSRLGNPQSGRQMSDPWIKNNLEKAVGKRQARKIQKAGYGRELFKIKLGNNGPNINVKTLNSKGYVVKTT